MPDSPHLLHPWYLAALREEKVAEGRGENEARHNENREENLSSSHAPGILGAGMREKQRTPGPQRPDSRAVTVISRKSIETYSVNSLIHGFTWKD